MTLQEPKPTPPIAGNTRHLSLPPGTYSEPVARQTGPLDARLPWVIEFRVVGTTSILQTHVSDNMLLGRLDNERKIFPEVDFSPYNAGQLGVSRKHAMITVRGHQLMLKDLGSTNGTRLNDSVLEPNREYRLHHGDQLMLGGLHLQIQFSVVPAQNSVRAAQAAELQLDATLPKLGRGERVLIIEDDINIGEVFRGSLERAGFKVTLVPNITQGLGIVFHQMPDAIILGMLGGDLSGLDLVRYVRKQGREDRRIPVVVVSSGAGYYKTQAVEAGADVVMGKPIAVEDLVRVVGTSLK